MKKNKSKIIRRDIDLDEKNSLERMEASCQAIMSTMAIEKVKR